MGCVHASVAIKKKYAASIYVTDSHLQNYKKLSAEKWNLKWYLISSHVLLCFCLNWYFRLNVVQFKGLSKSKTEKNTIKGRTLKVL